MKKGFTLVEVLIVVAIISVLAGIVVFSASSIRNKAGFIRAKDQIDQIAAGAFLYYQDTGKWAQDISLMTGNPNADFYTSQYIDLKSIEPLTYLGSTYKWDWQSWGNYDTNNGSPNNRTFEYTQPFGNMCWESVDLYREYDPVNNFYELVMRKCVRDVCINQKYCNVQKSCWNTAAGRDSGIQDIAHGYVGYVQNSACDSSKGCSAICEPCSSEGFGPGGCGNMFRP